MHKLCCDWAGILVVCMPIAPLLTVHYAAHNAIYNTHETQYICTESAKKLKSYTNSQISSKANWKWYMFSFAHMCKIKAKKFVTLFYMQPCILRGTSCCYIIIQCHENVPLQYNQFLQMHT